MKIKRGVTGIVYSEKNGKRYFLLLHRVLNWKGWEFPKGGIEEGEKLEETVLREIQEETALKDLKIVGKVAEKMEWKTESMRYVYDVFLVRGNIEEKIQLQEGVAEHDSFEWVEGEKVVEKLTHENNKEHFRNALLLLGG